MSWIFGVFSIGACIAGMQRVAPIINSFCQFDCIQVNRLQYMTTATGRSAQRYFVKKTRILHVIDSLDLGGAQEALENLVRFGSHGRFEFEVASLHRHGVYSARIQMLGVPVHSLSPHKLLPLYIPSLIFLLWRRRFDIVHCHLTWANQIAKPLARLMGVRLLFNHDQTNEQFRHHRGLRFSIDKLTNRLSTHVFAVSESIRKFLTDAEELPEKKVSLVYNGVDLDRFQFSKQADKATRLEWGLSPDHYLVGGIGRLHPQKNFHLFLRVAREIQDLGLPFRFFIAGDGALRSDLEQESAKLGLQQTVKFLGYVADTSPLFRSMDALMMTSDYEGLPLTLLEAMASGVPCICSSVDGIQEIVHHGENGLLASPGIAGDFVDALKRVCSDSSLKSRMVQNARQLVETRFSAQQMTRSVEKTYEECLAGVR